MMEEKTVSGILSHEHTKAHLTDVNYMPPLFEAVPLGAAHSATPRYHPSGRTAA